MWGSPMQAHDPTGGWATEAAMPISSPVPSAAVHMSTSTTIVNGAPVAMAPAPVAEFEKVSMWDPPTPYYRETNNAISATAATAAAGGAGGAGGAAATFVTTTTTGATGATATPAAPSAAAAAAVAPSQSQLSAAAEALAATLTGTSGVHPGTIAADDKAYRAREKEHYTQLQALYGKKRIAAILKQLRAARPKRPMVANTNNNAGSAVLVPPEAYAAWRQQMETHNRTIQTSCAHLPLPVSMGGSLPQTRAAQQQAPAGAGHPRAVTHVHVEQRTATEFVLRAYRAPTIAVDALVLAMEAERHKSLFRAQSGLRSHALMVGVSPWHHSALPEHMVLEAGVLPDHEGAAEALGEPIGTLSGHFVTTRSGGRADAMSPPSVAESVVLDSLVVPATANRRKGVSCTLMDVLVVWLEQTAAKHKRPLSFDVTIIWPHNAWQNAQQGSHYHFFFHRGFHPVAGDPDRWCRRAPRPNAPPPALNLRPMTCASQLTVTMHGPWPDDVVALLTDERLTKLFAGDALHLAYRHPAATTSREAAWELFVAYFFPPPARPPPRPAANDRIWDELQRIPPHQWTFF